MALDYFRNPLYWTPRYYSIRGLTSNPIYLTTLAVHVLTLVGGFTSPAVHDPTLVDGLISLALHDRTLVGGLTSLAVHDLTLVGGLTSLAVHDLTLVGGLASLAVHDITQQPRKLVCLHPSSQCDIFQRVTCDFVSTDTTDVKVG